MSEFDYDLFRQLVENLHNFMEYVGNDFIPDDRTVTDHKGQDITGCINLSIFPQLANIKEWGENIDSVAYHETKEEDRIVAAKGVIRSCMDWDGIGDPQYFYEIKHSEVSGTVEEQVREIHIDQLVLGVWGSIDRKQPNEPRGSEDYRAFIEKLVRECDDLTDQGKDDIKYKCLVEAENFEIWKVGLHQGPYQLFIAGNKFLCRVRADGIIKDYLEGKKLEKVPKLPEMDDDKFSALRFHEYNGGWYNKGAVDLDPDLTIKLGEEAQIRERKELADKIYDAATKFDFDDINASDLSKVVVAYEPKQIMMMLAASTTNEEGRRFRADFQRACLEYNTQGYETAMGLLNLVVDGKSPPD